MAADDSFELRCQKQKIAFFAPVGLALSLALFDQLRWEFEKGALVGKGGGENSKIKRGCNLIQVKKGKVITPSWIDKC